jgi:hypothetical protein
MTNDSHLFKTEPGPGRLPLYEGKMIHQFTHKWDASIRYWLDEKEARKSLLGNKKDENQIISYQLYRLAHRSIASSTNERTMISTILPPRVVFGHSMNLQRKPKKLFGFASLLNSFIVILR